MRGADIMLRGLWRLTWLEIKIFVREPLGVVGTVGVPVVIFVLFARLVGPGTRRGTAAVPRVFAADLPILASMLIAASALLSLVTIIAIYRESGILKRLRATPLRPYTILTAHVLVKLVFTALTLALLLLAGRRFYPVGTDVPVLSFSVALLFSTVCIISLGFLVASVVPTARFAQPVGALLVYPMLGVSGLFVPLESLPPLVQQLSRLLPFTYAVSLLRGIWHGAAWSSHAGDVVVLAAMFAVFTALSAWAFRWE
jgi:ABC-2 type transport system permease protein